MAHHSRATRRFALRVAAFFATLTAVLASSPGGAQAESPACLSNDPAAWPPPARPYFMLALDTSGSMSTTVAGAAPSCAGYPSTRTGHEACAISNTVKAFAGQVNFGLATFAAFQTSCTGACYTGCQGFCFGAEVTTTSFCLGCGPRPGGATTRAGANIVTPMLKDTVPPPATNVPNLLAWADNSCASSTELFALGNTPLNGMLLDMKRYFATGWTSPDLAVTFPTPLSASDPACRSINVILLTDGDETCDLQSDAVNAATGLRTPGVTVGGNTFAIKTHVINFAGGNQVNTDAIAVAGGTGASYFATNEIQLSQALANIIAGAIKPETCDNVDNNCNGCTDEGHLHYCNTGQTCCNLAKATCIAQYQASITAALPSGDLTLLPCTTVAAQAVPASWLCYDPKETCDGVDNNCQSGIDEGVVKCGSPAHCPLTEVCNGLDDDCDSLVDENVCPNQCVPSQETCDGCDNDCDGIIDNGVAPLACGLASPPNCVGQITCKAPQPAPFVGGCVATGGFNTCSNSPQAETCDGIDNNCNGIVDDGVPPTSCVPAGTPGGLVYGGASQCQQGTLACGGTCQGFVGPSSEVCDGIDNDCDGVVDDGVFGVGIPCGINQPPCSPGVTACVGGALVCQGGVAGTAEVCDGIDNDCDGQVDETPLSDAPAANQNGCWNLPGNCCTFQNLQFCAPPGANCFDNGTLAAPCNKGSLACSGASGWVCQNPKGPAPEACDGLDNDCNGQVDDGNIPQVGQVCGTNVGLCVPGALACTAGVLTCAGGVNPVPEVCDGLDNDCDGAIDNGIPVGGVCTVAYDAVAYPGPRTSLPCQPGTLQCNGMGALVCTGGVGPTPEVCDGIDNDCDGALDEVGLAPDGINGSANPLPPPAASIGDVCGVNAGACSEGAYACLNGQFACLGGQGALPEECDCEDNDCDGTNDEQDPGAPAICSPGKTCVKNGDSCQCAAPCSGELCPGGQTCAQVTSSETGAALGNYCVTDEDALCGDCSIKTVKDAGGNVLCAPANTVLDGCITPPVCVCKGQNGCQSPCFGVTCQGGATCLAFGPNAGTCGVDNCYVSPCQGCGKACNGGVCVDNPCQEDSCPADQVCKPNADFLTFTCVGSCSGVACPGGQKCEGGQCVPTCEPACPSGQVCDEGQSPPVCVADQCVSMPCTDGSCCDPLTGACGTCPCEGVLCPSGQECKEGDCFGIDNPSGSGGATATSSASSTSSTGSGVGGTDSDKVWGLATGGGGCACEVGSSRRDQGGLWLAAGLLSLALMRRRKGDRAAREVAR